MPSPVADHGAGFATFTVDAFPHVPAPVVVDDAADREGEPDETA